MISEVKGLVIRTTDVTENDKILTMFTHEKGRITVYANGSKTLKSRYMSAADVFCYGRYVLYQKGEKFWLRDVDLIESFFDLRFDITRMALANYVCDVAGDASTENFPDEDLLRLTLNTLFALSKNLYSPWHIKAAFEMRAACVLGFMPDLDECTVCGECEGENFYFDIMNGSVTCEMCRNGQDENYKEILESYNPAERRIICILSAGAIMAVRYIIKCPLPRLFSFAINEKDKTSLSHACEEYLLNHVERGFKSLDFYRQVSD